MLRQLASLRQNSCDAVIAKPVVNLRREPLPLPPFPQIKDRLQESQLLLGEALLIKEERDGWAYVEAIEQPRYCSLEGWSGYLGWVPKSSLMESRGDKLILTQELWTPCTLDEGGELLFSLGTCVEVIDCDKTKWSLRLPDGRRGSIALRSGRLLGAETRFDPEAAFALGQQFVGHPYFWGGRSVYHPDLPHSGVDCSALVQLLYRSQGWVIPRDAHDQFLSSHPRESEAAKCGDLFFLKEPEESPRITHVGLLGAADSLIESTERVAAVRQGRLLQDFPSQTIYLHFFIFS